MSNESRTSAEAAAMEREGKGKGKEIEHIEEASEEDDSGDEDAIGSDGSTDDGEARGRPHNSLGLFQDIVEPVSSSTQECPDGGAVFINLVGPSPKGKSVEGRTGVAL